jgi:hypothetical protein
MIIESLTADVVNAHINVPFEVIEQPSKRTSIQNLRGKARE